MKKLNPYAPATEILESGQSPETKRLAAYRWLGIAIMRESKQGYDVKPAFALLRALERLHFGQYVDEMLRLPEGQERGGKENPPDIIAGDAFALAAVAYLVDNGKPIDEAIELVALRVGRKTGSLKSFRKHVLAERGRKPAERKRYRKLIPAFEEETERLRPMPEIQVLTELVNFSVFS